MEGRKEDWGGIRVGGGQERRGENDSEREERNEREIKR
jgi:hypothetical protein